MGSEAESAAAREVLFEVFEEAAFLFAEPFAPPGPEAAAAWSPVGCALESGGPSPRRLSLWFDRRLAGLAAANMLGLDEEEPVEGEKSIAAAMELLNMIAGRLLDRLFGSAGGVPFGLPLEAGPEDWKRDASRGGGIWLEAEGLRAVLYHGVPA
jgi:hypothetical protein